MKPYVVKSKLDSLLKSYMYELEKLADKMVEDRIIPYCKKNNLSFTMMNGFMRLVDKDDQYVELPQFMVNMYDIYDDMGNLLVHQISIEYKHKSTDFNQVDIDNWKKRNSKKTLNESILGAMMAM